MVPHPRQSRRQRLVLAASAALFVLAGALIVLWVQSFLQPTHLHRRTTVLSGSVIEGTDPTAPPVTEYIARTRTIGSHNGRIYLGYLRADELNKSRGLPRHVSWHVYVSPTRDHDRYDAPPWLAALGFDWEIGHVREGARANGEYWSNRDIFMTIPHYALAVLAGGGGWLVGRRTRLVRRRCQRGLCPACGYDLRATPGRCPECGRGGASSSLEANAR